MTEQEIKSEIIERLHQGTSKAIVYDEFKDNIKDESLRKILASRPSYELKLKFKNAHLLLSIIWGCYVLLEFIGSLPLIASLDIKSLLSLTLAMYITYKIWNFDGRYFLPGIFWFVVSIFNSFSELHIVEEYELDYGILLISFWIYSLFLIGGIFLMYHIRKNVFSYYIWFQPILNEDNEIQFENKET